jgi:hypothetical protein
MLWNGHTDVPASDYNELCFLDSGGNYLNSKALAQMLHHHSTFGQLIYCSKDFTLRGFDPQK